MGKVDIGGQLDNIVKDVEEGLKEIGQTIVNVTEGAIEKGKEVFEEMKPGLKEVGEGVKEASAKAWDGATDVWDDVRNKTANLTVPVDRNESVKATKYMTRAFVYTS